MLAHSCEMVATCHFYLFVVFETCCVILRCISIWYEFIFWEYDCLFLIFMLILSLLRNGIGIFNQNCINMHLKNVKILTEDRWHCIVKKVMQLNMFKTEIFPDFHILWIQHLAHWIFLQFPVKEACFCISYSGCDHCLFRTETFLGISTVVVLFGGYPMLISLIAWDWNSFPVCVADWAPDYWGTDVWEIFIPRWEDDSY